MNIIYFDCFAGISGDMTLGALVDVGADFDVLKAELSKLNLEGYNISCERKVKKGISAVDINIDTHHHDHSHTHHSHRSFTDIKNMIENSNLSDRVKKDAVGVFRILGEAEAKIHGIDIEEIHFHEVGAVDSIVDIVGVCICIDILKIDEVYCSRLPIFYGTVQIAHGTFPLPAPATAEILKDVPFTGDGIEGEIITPTGAAILKYFSKGFGSMPAMTIKNTGYGAGKKDFGLPNVLRVISGEKYDNKENATIAVIEANIDDLSSQIYEIVMEKAFANGAMDVYITNIQMKKNRPAHLITILCNEEDIEKMSNIIFEETSSIGVRIDKRQRICLDREIKTIETKYGSIRFKLAAHKDGKIVNAQPEYEDIKNASAKHNLPFKIVRDYAISEYYNSLK